MPEPAAGVAAHYYRLARDPRGMMPMLRREAERLARLAAAAPEIDTLIALSRIDLTPAPPDDPSARCCSWCGSSVAKLTAEEGFGDEMYCADSASCVARQRTRVPPLPVPDHLAVIRDAAGSAGLELSAMTEAARAFARDYGRQADEFLMLAAPTSVSYGPRSR